MIEYQVMIHIFPENFIKIPQPVHFPKKMNVLITIVSSTINEVTRAILNFFFQKFYNPQNTKRLQGNKNKKYS